MAVAAPDDEGCRTGLGHCPVIRERGSRRPGEISSCPWVFVEGINIDEEMKLRFV
jgi:hypothetical protein